MTSFISNQPNTSIISNQQNTSFINNQSNITNLPFESTSVQYSFKHNALYLYVSRLLRPLWNIKAVNMETADGKTYVIHNIL